MTTDNTPTKKMKPLSVINKYFNTSNDPEGYIKKSTGEFREETRALDPEEKLELATLAAKDMGIQLDA